MNAGSQRWATGPRLALLGIAAVFALAALLPEAALHPLRGLVAQMRTPTQAIPVARAFLFAACGVSVLAALAWERLADACARAAVAVERWPARRFWVVAAIVAAAPRLLVALALPYEPTSDAQWYHEVAQALASGQGFAFAGSPTAFRSPGYPLLLSALYRIGGPHVAWAWLLGAVATALLLLAVHSIARTLHDERTARIALLLAATYPALVLMTGQVLSDLVFTAGLFATLACALRVDGTRPRHAVAVGFAAGLLTLARTVGIGLFAIVPALWWLRRRDTRAYLRALALAVIAGSLFVLPWMVRNAAVLDRFTIGTNAGSNLLTGNRPGATGWRDSFDVPSSVLAADGEVARDDAMKREAWQFVREQPLAALAILPGKLAGMYLLETQAVTSLFQGERHASDTVRHGLYGLSEFAWLAVAALVVARVARWNSVGRPRGAEWIGWILVGYFTLICLVFHGEDRYRLPVLPWFLIEAAAALAGGTQPRRRSISPLSSSSDAN